MIPHEDPEADDVCCVSNRLTKVKSLRWAGVVEGLVRVAALRHCCFIRLVRHDILPYDAVADAPLVAPHLCCPEVSNGAVYRPRKRSLDFAAFIMGISQIIRVGITGAILLAAMVIIPKLVVSISAWSLKIGLMLAFFN